MTTLLEVKGLKAFYGATQALHDVSFTLAEGGINVLRGTLAPQGSVVKVAGLSAEQNAAVKLAVSGALTVVTGGPGTGKTLVAAAIVRAFTQLGVGPIAQILSPEGKPRAAIVYLAHLSDVERMLVHPDAKHRPKVNKPRTASVRKPRSTSAQSSAETKWPSRYAVAHRSSSTS